MKSLGCIAAIFGLTLAFTLAGDSTDIRAAVLLESEGTPNATSDADDAWQALKSSLSYRSLGPFRGGRSATCTGVIGRPNEFLFGSAGGGVWKTDDGGHTWFNLSDGYFGGSIGAVAVAPSDPNVIYVGGGEKTVRGNVSHGDGLWKSVDAGKTWQAIGLEDTQFVPRIRIHPHDPDTVYVAALGHLYGPNQQRGVFRSRDGGRSWQQVLFVNDETGAVDLLIDPTNPRILYATMWQVKRTPYSLESGGPGSGLWKSTDGGDHWEEITRRPGLPQGTIGISGIAVSPVNGQRVWALIEAEDGGLFRSDDGAATFKKINDRRDLRQRAWYYTRVYAGPQDLDEVYVVNVEFWRSQDGGTTFKSIDTPHGDHHDLWIDPSNPDRMIVADDGGAQVSFNRGQTFSTYMNQPTSQFYRVTTDNHFPYRIYGAQQDNSTVRILHRTDSGSIGESHWEPTAGGESGHIAPHPLDPDVVFGGSYGGYLTRENHRTKETRNVHIWPDNPMGYGAGSLKYRFQWNFPICFSPHAPHRLYAAANVLFVSEDEGQSWRAISPDLTRNAPQKLGPSGGPITKDNTSVEYYCTIFAVAPSPHEAEVIWVGSDDGLVHITRDGGKDWVNVTPPDLPEWAQINSIEVNPHQPGGAYIAATRYKSDDFNPYLYKTDDYGQTWTKITTGIDRKHFTRVLRADPDRAGLLYAGTERGIYLSWNDGESWESFQLNLPVVPITDMTIKNKDLIVATQGRSFYVLDDLSPLHQWNAELTEQDWAWLQPRDTYRMSGGGSGVASRTTGANPRPGVQLRFFVGKLPETGGAIELVNAAGEVVRRFSTDPAPESQDLKLDLKPGFNTLYWDLRHAGAETFPGLVLWGGGTGGPRAVPGRYEARWNPNTPADGDSAANAEAGDEDSSGAVVATSFQVLPDPRSSASVEDMQAQLELLLEIRDKLTETHRAIKNLRELKNQLESWRERLVAIGDHRSLVEEMESVAQQLTTIEEALYQTKLQSPQDPLNFPIRLNNRLSGLVGVVGEGDFRPTSQAYLVRDEIVGLIDEQLAALDQIVSQRVPEINQGIQAAAIPALQWPQGIGGK
jgi:photosystem II stability/assembly factor-like uncharacterized protein